MRSLLPLHMSGPPARTPRSKESAPGPLAPRKSFVRNKSIFRSRGSVVKRDDDETSPRHGNTMEVHEQLNQSQLSRLKDQLEQLLHRLESEGKKAAENTARIELLEAKLREIEQTNLVESGDHEDIVSVEKERMEELQVELAEAQNEREELNAAVVDVVDGEILKKRSNALRLEQLVNFVLSGGTSGATDISADDIDRDVTGERVRALAHYEEGDHAGKEIRISFQRRRELWENYEYLWLRESDTSFKPKYSNESVSYYAMLDPHRCRWNTCVLDRCASEYMEHKAHAWMSAIEWSGDTAPTPSIQGALAAARAAKALLAKAKGNRRNMSLVATVPLPSPSAAKCRDFVTSQRHDNALEETSIKSLDAEEHFFPHPLRR